MNLPVQAPGAYAMAFALWGAATGEWLWAALAAAALELPRLLRRTFDVDERGFRMMWLLTLFLLWAMAINAWLENDRIEALRGMLEWAPFAMLPVMLVSAWATRPGVPLSALLLLLKGRYTRPSMGGVRPVVPVMDPFFPCLWVMLLSISHQGPGKWFFWGCFLVMAWVFLYPAKGRARWAMRIGLVVVAFSGLFLHLGVLRLYHIVDNAMLSSGRRGSELEANRSITRIGSVETIKNSSAIRWRVTRESGPNPSYLVDATFNYFNQTIWNNSEQRFRVFQAVLPPPAAAIGLRWAIAPDPGPTEQQLRIRGRPNLRWTILPLTPRVNTLDNLPTTRVERNGLGVVRVDSEVPVLDFVVESGAQNTMQPPPDAEDLQVPGDLEPVLRPIEQEIGLHRLAPVEAAAALRKYFLTNFSYSKDPAGASVADFLTKTRRGHCEYFGTAAALLLRSAGIPARYQTGFSVSEFQPDKNQWVVRGVHAHAWTIAWIDGTWKTVDATPADWLASDQDRVPAWQAFLDWWDEKWMAFEIWRETSDPAALIARLSPWVFAIVILYTAIRFWMGRRKAAAARRLPSGPAYGPDDLCTAWAQVRPEVERACGPRPEALPPLAWVETMAHWPEGVRSAARLLVRDHYRRRFGPSRATTNPGPDLGEASALVRQQVGASASEGFRSPTG